MNFLKRHYEKLLLVLMLIIFLFTLFYQVDIITGADKITPDDLKLPPMHADYENTKFSNPEFKNRNIFIKDTAWNPTKPSNPKVKVFTDLMLNFKSARCPHPTCKKIIPRYFFYNKPHKCPICNGNLPKPPNPDDIKIDDKRPPPKGDTDGDGIPDRVELQWGSNPNKHDSGTDTDGDGFANIYEYENKTHGGNPKSHPPLYLRLSVQDIRRTLLDIRLKKIMALGTDKSDWDVQVNVKGGRKSTFLVIDDIITIDKKRYKLTDIKVIMRKTPERSVVVDKDVSEITLKSLKGDDTIVAVRNQDVYSSKPQAILIDELDGREYKVEQGAILTIGSLQTKRERYQVLKVDPAKEEVILKNLKALKYLRKGTKCRVTKTLMIPKTRKEVESTDGMGEDGMPGDPAMMDPGSRNNRTRRRPGTTRRPKPGEPLI